MTIKSDKWIIEQCRENEMISPYTTEQVKEQNGRKIISYGVSSYGYDIRVANEFKVCYDREEYAVIDPKKDMSKLLTTFYGESGAIYIPPNSYALCRSIEKFKIPEDVLVVCVGKSTYARCGLIVNVTPLEPGWEGYLTIELSNTTPMTVKVYIDEGIAQLLFYKSDERCIISYKDKEGKYQNQVGVTGALL